MYRISQEYRPAKAKIESNGQSLNPIDETNGMNGTNSICQTLMRPNNQLDLFEYGREVLNDQRVGWRWWRSWSWSWSWSRSLLMAIVFDGGLRRTWRLCKHRMKWRMWAGIDANMSRLLLFDFLLLVSRVTCQGKAVGTDGWEPARR